MAAAEVPILLSHDADGTDFLHDLPRQSKNIFQRIIRNPRPESPDARERECTEMLAAVLLNAPLLRRGIFGWLAGRGGFDPSTVNDLDFEIDTEQHIGVKRDDLRIEGWKKGRESERGLPDILWTIEVKVGSPIHASRRQRLGRDGEIDSAGTLDAIDEESDSQLRNYDHWLCQQNAKSSAGFVLALRDLTSDVADLRLNGKWTCVSWTALGIEVKAAIEKGDLPPEELMLGRHLFGFIAKNLWRTDQMPDAMQRVDFNDIALLRAFSKIGRECERKVDRLIAGAAPVLKASGIGCGEIRPYRYLYKDSSCSTIHRFLIPGLSKDDDPSLSVAIGCTVVAANRRISSS